MVSNEFEDYYDGILQIINNTVGAKKYSSNLAKKNYFRIKTGFYEDENPEEVANEIIFSVKDSINENKILTEAKGISEPIRRVVRDLTNIVKTQNYGNYNLPEEVDNRQELEYDFDMESEKWGMSRSYNVPPFTIEFTYDANHNIDEPYMINGSLMSDGDTISVLVIINPKHYPSLLYDLIADLNDIVAHEIEHLYQENFMRPDDEIHWEEEGWESPDGKEYYMQSHEVPAQLKGLMRVAKLRKQPIEQVISDWFKRSKYAHHLNDDDVKYMVDFLSNEYKKRYGAV